MVLITQGLTFRGEFDLPIALLIGTVQDECLLKQRTSLQARIVTVKKNEGNKFHQLIGFFSPSFFFFLKASESYLTPKEASA